MQKTCKSRQNDEVISRSRSKTRDDNGPMDANDNGREFRKASRVPGLRCHFFLAFRFHFFKD